MDRMVKNPPVVEVSSWSVLIFLKKSNDFSIIIGDNYISLLIIKLD